MRVTVPHKTSSSSQSSSMPAMAIPLDHDQLAVQLKKRLVRKALWGSGAALIPIPLLDLAVDAALLSSMLNEIHQTFGLTPEHLKALDPAKRHKTFTAIQWVGNHAIGKLVTQALVKTLLTRLGVKLTAGQLVKVVPVAGQIASAALTYAALRHLVTRHIDDCVSVLKRAETL
jgi:uncharacterized protein (DUF697 family)